MDIKLTKPWAADEFIHVNGAALVYSHGDDGEMVIHYPGGDALHLSTVLALGARVDMPVDIRRQRFVRVADAWPMSSAR